MRTTTVAMAGIAGAALLCLTACSGSSTGGVTGGGNASACEAALVKQLQDDENAGGATPTMNYSSIAPCVGLSPATLSQLSQQATQTVLKGILPSGVPTALPTGISTSDLPTGLPTDLPTSDLPTGLPS